MKKNFLINILKVATETNLYLIFFIEKIDVSPSERLVSS